MNLPVHRSNRISGRPSATRSNTSPRSVSSQPTKGRFKRAFVAALLSLSIATLVQAQEPFAQDSLPTFSFSESYVEVLKATTEDGYTYYDVGTSDSLSQLVVSGKVSATGIDLGAVNAETPFALSIGDFEISGVLGDDPTYVPGKTSITIPITDFDDETGEEYSVGSLTLSWEKGFVTVRVKVQRPDVYSVVASGYAGTEDPIEDAISATFSFADRELGDRTVYMSGTANVRTKTVGSGDDAESFDLSSVNVSGAIDSVRPTVKLLGLKDSALVGDEVISIAAKASDNIEVADVQVSLNDEEEYVSLTQDDDTGNAWSIGDLPLNYGSNVIRVKAIDIDGNESVINQITVRRGAPLVVSVNGDGTVTKGFSGTTLREVGSVISLKAVPNNGSVFSGWTGAAVSSAPTVSFVMQPGANVVANFIPNPFPAVKGAFNGLVLGGDGSAAGALNLQLTPSGSFSAKVTLGGKTETLTGSFDAAGHFTGTINRKGDSALSVDLQVDLGGSDTVSGTISDGANTLSVKGDRSVYGPQNPAPQAGVYTVSLPAPEAKGAPQGDGYATLNVSASGVASFAGALPDGTPFSYSAPVSKAGKLPFFLDAYKGKGFVSGVISFRSTPGVGDLDADLRWTKAVGGSSDGFYPAGFDLNASLVGARYAAPAKGVRALDLGVTGAAVVALGEGGLGAPITKSVSFAANNKVAVLSPAADKLSVEITAGNGVFAGSFVDPVSRKSRRFTGVLLQSQKAGAGLFRGTSSAGYVSLAAPAAN